MKSTLMKKNKIKIEPKEYFEDLQYDGEGNEFYSKYLNKWIAIVNKQVVAFGDDPIEVTKEASLKTGKPEEEIPIRYVYDQLAIL